MILILFCIPIGLLSLYLATLAWKKSRRIGLVFFLLACLTLGFAGGMIGLIHVIWQRL